MGKGMSATQLTRIAGRMHGLFGRLRFHLRGHPRFKVVIEGGEVLQIRLSARWKGRAEQGRQLEI